MLWCCAVASSALKSPCGPFADQKQCHSFVDGTTFGKDPSVIEASEGRKRLGCDEHLTENGEVSLLKCTTKRMLISISTN